MVLSPELENLINNYKFLFRNTSWLRFSPLKRDLRWEFMYPAAENILSDGVDMAGIARYSLAILAKVEKRVMFLFHHAKGSSFLSNHLRSINAIKPATTC